MGANLKSYITKMNIEFTIAKWCC